MTARPLLAALAVLALALPAQAAAPARPAAKPAAVKKVAAPNVSAVRPDDMTLGSPKAKITVVEYASLSCPHCARFNNDVFPAFKAKYVDSGQVLYIFREFYTDPVQLAAAGAALARCAPKDKYFTVIDGFFRNQEAMYETAQNGGDLMTIINKVGAAAGLNPDKVKACITDQKAVDAVTARVEREIDQDKIGRTPTIFVNGKEVVTTTEIALADLDKAIAAAKKK